MRMYFQTPSIIWRSCPGMQMILDSIAQYSPFREKRNPHRAQNVMSLRLETGKHILGKSEFLSSVISFIVWKKEYICKFESGITICFLKMCLTSLKKAVIN